MYHTLYYTAKRSTSLTDTENASIKSIIDKYYNGKQDFCVYRFSGNDIVFNGFVEIPSDNGGFSAETTGYWIMCLNEITRILSGCQWEVNFDNDLYMIWNTDIMCWRYPTDTEYSRQNIRLHSRDNYNSFMEKIINRYCTQEHIIDGIRTYIIPPEYYDDIYRDTEVSDISAKDLLLSHIDFYRRTPVDKLYLSAVYLLRKKMYISADCYEYDGKLYHVAVKSGWVCLECRKPNTFDGWCAMPQYEDDADFPICEVPPIFQKIPCRYCGKPLNRRFLKLAQNGEQYE